MGRLSNLPKELERRLYELSASVMTLGRRLVHLERLVGVPSDDLAQSDLSDEDPTEVLEVDPDPESNPDSNSDSNSDSDPAPGPDEAEPSTVYQPELVIQTGHTDYVAAVAVSPDGAFLLTGGDQTARLWEVSTGRELRAFVGHNVPVQAVAFHPDGRSIVTGSTEGVRVFSMETGDQLERPEGHDWGGVRLIGFSESGHVFTGGNVATWECTVGPLDGSTETKIFGTSAVVESVALAPGGDLLAAGLETGEVEIWSCQTGEEVCHIDADDEADDPAVTALAFSADGTRLLSGRRDGNAILWDIPSGEALLTFETHDSDITGVAFTGDGKSALTSAGGGDGTIRVFSVATLGASAQRQPAQRLPGHGIARSVVAAPDGLHIASCGDDRTAKMWELDSGDEVRRFEGSVDKVRSLALSANGRSLLTGGDTRDLAVRLWSLRDGIQSQRIPIPHALVLTADFEVRGDRVLISTYHGGPLLVSLESGEILQRFKEHGSGGVYAARLGPDGSFAVSADHDRTIRLWDTATGLETARLDPPGDDDVPRFRALALSANGRYLAAGGWSESKPSAALLFERMEGDPIGRDVPAYRVIRRFDGSGVSALRFSPDNRHLLIADGSRVGVWDIESGVELRWFAGDYEVTTALFSPDGRFAARGGVDGSLTLSKATELDTDFRDFEGHTAEVTGARFSPDGRHLFSCSMDGTVRLWDAASQMLDPGTTWHENPLMSKVLRPHGEELARMISFADGGWAVVDASGRFDGSNGGDVPGLHWVVGMETLSLAQLKERYYDPGLLAKVLGHHDEPPRPVESFNEIGVQLHPEVTVVHSPDAEDGTLKIDLHDRGGGVGRVQVLINGKEVTADARPSGANTTGSRMELSIDLSGSPLLIPGVENDIEVVAHNAEGYLAGRGVRLGALGAGKATAPTELRALVVGVSDYGGDALDLKFAAKDARDFSAALRTAADKLFPGRVHLQTLIDKQVTRDALKSAFDVLGHAQPTDILVVYLAGHGVTWGGAEGDYYYLLGDARSFDLSDPAVRREAAVSADELTEFIKAVPALKQVLVLDTCASGQLIADLTEGRSASSSQVRALERMKDRTGMFVLAGSAADAVSYETTRYGQGLLTYSLLLGMKGAALRESEFVDVATWFNYAVERVPDLAVGIGGIQQPRLAIPRGGESFDIGHLTPDDRASIPLATAKPLLVRPIFQEEASFADPLRLTAHLGQALRTAGEGTAASYVYVDAWDFPDAHQLVGRYSTADGQTTVTFRVVPTPTVPTPTVPTPTVPAPTVPPLPASDEATVETGESGDVPALVAKVVRSVISKVGGARG